MSIRSHQQIGKIILMFHSWKESQCLQTRGNFKHHCRVSHHFTQFTIPALGPRTSNPSSNIAWAGGVASGLCWQEGRAEISRCQRGVMSCRNRCALNCSQFASVCQQLRAIFNYFPVDPNFFVEFLCLSCWLPPFPQKKNSGMYSPLFFCSELHPMNLPLRFH